jgi:hypothetical protein
MAAPLPPAATATPGGTGGAALDTGQAAVTTVADKAFVLKDGIWTDTTFDPTVMETTQLPFPSDLFLEFLNQHPEAGKFFALGPHVIVMIDGMAYETVPVTSEQDSGSGVPANPDTPQSEPDQEAQPPQKQGSTMLPAGTTVLLAGFPIGLVWLVLLGLAGWRRQQSR